MTVFIVSQDVYDITAQDLTTDDISSADLTDIINFAISEVNNAICVKVIEERVKGIDTYRENLIDGSNTEYFPQTSWTWYIGDFDDDGEIDSADAQVWLYNASAKTRTAAAISSIDEVGKITLTTAPPTSIDKMTITYKKSPVSISDSLLKKACAELSASIAYGGVDAREKKRVAIRGFSISKNPEAERNYFNRYLQTLSQLISRQSVIEKKQEITLKPIEFIHDLGRQSL